MSKCTGFFYYLEVLLRFLTNPIRIIALINIKSILTLIDYKNCEITKPIKEELIFLVKKTR